MPAQRLFVSLEVPASIGEALVRLDPGLPEMRWVAPEQLHLTLAFLDQVALEPAADLRMRLAAIHFSRFFLPLQGIGTFPAKGRPKMIWLGVGRGHPHLFQLHKRVTDAALTVGIEPDLRPWHPHFTLARCEDVTPQKMSPFLRAHADFDGGLVPIDAFQLKSSQLTPNGSDLHDRAGGACTVDVSLSETRHLRGTQSSGPGGHYPRASQSEASTALQTLLLTPISAG